MKARLLMNRKRVWNGWIVQMVVWELPHAIAERPHGIKYRFYCGRDDECAVRYDNETGKGDHRHYGNTEEPYTFVSVERLIEDFTRDVERLTGWRLE